MYTVYHCILLITERIANFGNISETILDDDVVQEKPYLPTPFSYMHLFTVIPLPI